MNPDSTIYSSDGLSSVAQAVVTQESRRPETALEHELQLTAQLQSRLNKIADNATNAHEVIGSMIKLLLERDNVVGCLMLRRNEGSQFQIAIQSLKDQSLNTAKIAECLFPRIQENTTLQLPVIASIEQLGLECVVVPTAVMDLCALVTIVKSPVASKQRSLELAISQLCSSFLVGLNNQKRVAEISSEMATTAATLELIMGIQASTSVHSACLQIVAELKTHWNCDQVFIGLKRDNKTCKLAAVSDVAVVDNNSESSINRKAVLDECIGRGTSGSWPPLPNIEPHRLLAHKQLALRDSLVISTPLKTSDGKVIGALAMTGRRNMASVPNLQNLVSAFGKPIAETLEVVRINHGGPVRRAIRATTAHDHRFKRAALLVTLSMVGGLMALPWDYTIRCKSLIEPVERRYCVAPQDGLLETTVAEPGQVVKPSELLARMDGREIRWDLSGVVADKSRAAKQRDTHMAKHETAKAQMADLEVKRLENKMELLEFREANLDMVSPIEGIVLSGSLDRRENYPVSKGQVLYEIAPIDELRVEIAIPADEITHVKIGDDVRIHFDGFGMDAVEATIKQIRPRAEIRGELNVFVAEAFISNVDRKLKPGMEGIAKVKTESRSVGWVLFHRAIERVYAALPW